MQYIPELTYFFPTLKDSAVTDLRPTIILDWSVDVDTAQFSVDAARAQLVVLMDDETSTVIPTSYVSYTANTRRLTLIAAQDLPRGKKYRIFVRNGVASTDGRKSTNKYQWDFNTDSVSLSPVTLLSPANASILDVFPTLSWSSTATGTVYYRVVLDDNWNFVSPLYTSTTTSSAITPAGSFDSETTYYWRVESFTSSVSGVYSDINSFYFGSVQIAHPTSNQTWADVDTFGITKIGFTNGATHLPAFPTISFTFSSTPASDFASYVTAKKKAQLPRNDDVSSYLEADVAGTWSLSGKKLTFTPSETISKNMRYDFTVDGELLNTDGIALDEDYSYYVSGMYDPYYVDKRAVRARLLGAEGQIPDDLINFWIYQASLEANARFYGYIMVPTMYSYYGDTLTEKVVRDSSNLKSFGVLKWVEAAATYKILQSVLMEQLRDVGRSRKLGDYADSLSKDFIDAMKLALDTAGKDLVQWENYLIPSDLPKSAARSADWSPATWDWDQSVNWIESHRDDNWL